jgi:hypothetical protein
MSAGKKKGKEKRERKRERKKALQGAALKYTFPP